MTKKEPSNDDLRNSSTVRADKVFNQLLADKGLSEDFQRRYIAAHWEQLFGHFTAKHVRVINLENKKLFLHCDSSVWSDTINLRKMEMMGEINKFAGSDLVHDILFVQMDKPRASFGPASPPPDLRKDDERFRRNLQATPISDDELESIKERSKQVTHDDVRKVMERLQIKHAKLQKMHLANGWHPCASCDCLIEPEATLCFTCSLKSQQTTDAKIRKILLDEPWAKYKDILHRVNCTPYMVNKQRASLLKETFSRIDMEHQDNEAAVFLTMLFKQITMDVIAANPSIIQDTIKLLRYDIGDSYFKYMEEHPEETAEAQRAKKIEEHKPKNEYQPKKQYEPRKKYEPPKYTPGQQRKSLKAKKK